MKLLQAYVDQWGYGELITRAKCIGRFMGCFQDCTLEKCAYRQV